MFDYSPGATPLDENELEGLIPSLSTRSELDEFEAVNIFLATDWADGAPALRVDYPNVGALLRLHKEMFSLTWKWAGSFRRSDKNIGVHWPFIPEQLKALCDDTRYWTANSTYPWLELGARFHHRLVSIHPFPNGNGRHARLATDILLRQHSQPAFTWGSASLVTTGPMRQTYIAALQAADADDIGPLMIFAVS